MLETHQWNGLLIRFANQVIPFREYLSKAKGVCRKVFEFFKHSNGEFKIDRCIIAGSLGKKTSILYSDLDLVIFFNDVTPHEDFKTVVDAMYAMLLNSTTLGVRELRKTLFNVQFSIDNMDVDLSPAGNLVPFTARRSQKKHQLAKLQLAETLNKYGDLNQFYRMFYSSGLCQSRVFFMKAQSSFAHQLARLSKFWFQTLYMEGCECNVNTLKYVIEIIAVYSEYPERSAVGSKSMYRAFLKMLSILSSERFLIAFGSDSHPLILTGNRENDDAAWRLRFPDWVEAINRRSFISDPVDPNKNLADNFNLSEIARSKLADYADATIARLIDGDYAMTYVCGCPTTDYVRLFYPQPRVLPPIVNFPNLRPRLARVAVIRGVNPRRLTIVTSFREGSELESDNKKLVVEGIKKYLTVIVASVNLMKIRLDAGVKQKVEDAVGSSFMDDDDGLKDWLDLGDVSHDVAFEFPCGRRIVEVCFSW